MQFRIFPGTLSGAKWKWAEKSFACWQNSSFFATVEIVLRPSLGIEDIGFRTRFYQHIDIWCIFHSFLLLAKCSIKTLCKFDVCTLAPWRAVNLVLQGIKLQSEAKFAEKYANYLRFWFASPQIMAPHKTLSSFNSPRAPALSGEPHDAGLKPTYGCWKKGAIWSLFHTRSPGGP